MKIIHRTIGDVTGSAALHGPKSFGRRSTLFIHVIEPQFEVKVTKVDPRFATLLQEQFGGGNGEPKAGGEG